MQPGPDLQIRERKGGGGEGVGHPEPEIRGAAPPQIFLALWASFWSKTKGGGVPQALPLDQALKSYS